MKAELNSFGIPNILYGDRFLYIKKKQGGVSRQYQSYILCRHENKAGLVCVSYPNIGGFFGDRMVTVDGAPNNIVNWFDAKNIFESDITKGHFVLVRGKKRYDLTGWLEYLSDVFDY